MSESQTLQHIAEKYINLVDGEIVVSDNDQLIKEMLNEVGTTPEEVQRVNDAVDIAANAIATIVNGISAKHMEHDLDCNEHAVSVELGGKWINITTRRNDS